jgi:ubiquinone/menaquinone biosynthesis C-methylase UbiE
MSDTRDSRQVDYNSVSPDYDKRYSRNRWGGVEATLLDFAGHAPNRILEVGCGTGHWLSLLAERGHVVTGLDRSLGMLSCVPTDASPLSGAPVSSLLPVPGTAQGAEWAFEIPIRTGG